MWWNGSFQPIRQTSSTFKGRLKTKLIKLIITLIRLFWTMSIIKRSAANARILEDLWSYGLVSSPDLWRTFQKICEFFQTAVDFKYKYVILCQKTQHLFLPLNNKAKRKWNILWFLIRSGNILRFRNDTGLVIVATCIWTLSFVG